MAQDDAAWAQLQRWMDDRKVVVRSLNTISQVHAGVAIEAPSLIQAEAFFDGVVGFGAFSAAFGGRLRHTVVGRYCSIAPGLQTGWDDHPVDRLTSSMAGYVPDIHGWSGAYAADPAAFHAGMQPFRSIRGVTTIGHDVWIGANVFLRTGVTIGNGAIVGTGSVVTRDVAPYTIVAGNPARVIKPRFTPDVVELLERSQWWRYNIFDLPAGMLSDPAAAALHVCEAAAAGLIRPHDAGTLDEALVKTLIA